MTTLPEALAGLPLPGVIQEIDYEARLALFVEKLVALFADVGITYDVGGLEADPAKILLEAATYADVLLRQRINEAVRANLLAFAYGSDLDHLAAFYEVVRLFQESDERLRERVILAIQGRSTGGTEPRYKYVAMTSDVRVADAAVYTVGRDPTIQVAIFSTEPNGVASAGLLTAVDAALQDPAVRMVNDRIVVAGAVKHAVNVVANVWLLPSAAPSVATGLEAIVRSEWDKVDTLGFDLARSWLTAKLMQPGVQRVEIVAPAADISVPFNEAASLGTVTINNMGRGF
ncbi:MAG: baseplate J/gp47 family protein [Devosia sp.]|uniref:baseplate assembly protein n=1 Tax=Devosia sp. TaxID=1871048 RepID=UPI001ACCF3FE|nr:baseplate J/gp47 family protein [Devosia sp.]MBN9308721.1 baseplate J/gp47 family protein [Devosia sp.]MBN9314245.1 baseplate J/gp47 family protein [Devosia sp.]